MKSNSLVPLKGLISASIVMSGSKSYTNRALIMAALVKGKSVITGISICNDSLIMIKALRQLGVKITQVGTRLEIIGNGGVFKKRRLLINVDHAGTAMRFLTAVCSIVPGEIILDGSERMRQRPVGELVNALRQLGVRIEYLKTTGCPPLKIFGARISKNKVLMKGKISSQFFTALLLLGSALENGLNIKVAGEQISKSYINMTIAGLKQFGAKVINDHYQRYLITNQEKLKPTQYHVEGDASGASYFWGFAAITGSRIRIKNINPESLQGDVKFPDILQKMGCQVIKNNSQQWIEVKGTGNLKAINVDMSLMPDTAQTLAVIAAFAEGKTKITGLSTLRIKETDRLQALKNELGKVGIKSTITRDSIIVVGGKPKGNMIDVYNDHRMAMAFAIMGTKIPGIIITNPDVVSKSFPHYWKKLASLGIKFIS